MVRQNLNPAASITCGRMCSCLLKKALSRACSRAAFHKDFRKLRHRLPLSSSLLCRASFANAHIANGHPIHRTPHWRARRRISDEHCSDSCHSQLTELKAQLCDSNAPDSHAATLRCMRCTISSWTFGRIAVCRSHNVSPVHQPGSHAATSCCTRCTILSCTLRLFHQTIIG